MDTVGSAPVGCLSVRELQVLQLAVLGLTDREIAGRLRLSAKGACKVGTVKTYMLALRQAAGVPNRTALATWVAEHPGVLVDGRFTVGPHPRGCACGFSYCGRAA